VKRASKLSLALALVLAPAAVRAQAPVPVPTPRPAAQAGAAVDPISTYLRQDTQVALIIDLAQVDLDQLMQYATAKAKEAKVPQADIDKGMAEAKPQIDQAKGVLTQMKQAGASKVYALINVQGAMAGEFGTVFIPTSSPQNAQKVADLLKGMMNPEAEDAPGKISTAGNVALFQSKQAAAQPPAAPVGEGSGNPTLLAALRQRAAAPAAAISLIVDAKAFAPFAQQVEGDDKALLEGTQSISLSANFPPKPTFNASVTAKDAATAQKIAAKFNESLEKGRNDPAAKQVLGNDTAALYNAFKPQVQGNTISVNLDTKVIEEVVAPAFAKAAGEMQKQQGGAAAPGNDN